MQKLGFTSHNTYEQIIQIMWKLFWCYKKIMTIRNKIITKSFFSRFPFWAPKPFVLWLPGTIHNATGLTHLDLYTRQTELCCKWQKPGHSPPKLSTLPSCWVHLSVEIGLFPSQTSNAQIENIYTKHPKIYQTISVYPYVSKPNINIMTLISRKCFVMKQITADPQNQPRKKDILKNVNITLIWVELSLFMKQFTLFWIKNLQCFNSNCTKFCSITHAKITMNHKGNIFQQEKFQTRKFNTQVMEMACTVGNQVWLNCLDKQSGAVSDIYGYLNDIVEWTEMKTQICHFLV